MITKFSARKLCKARPLPLCAVLFIACLICNSIDDFFLIIGCSKQNKKGCRHSQMGTRNIAVLSAKNGAAGCACFSKMHFSDDNVCIQDLRPNHYEGDGLSDENSRPHACADGDAEHNKESAFIRAILESELRRDRPTHDHLKTVSNIDAMKSIFDEIKLGLVEEDGLKGPDSSVGKMVQ